jgi:hypothetical protein
MPLLVLCLLRNSIIELGHLMILILFFPEVIVSIFVLVLFLFLLFVPPIFVDVFPIEKRMTPEQALDDPALAPTSEVRHSTPLRLLSVSQ